MVNDDVITAAGSPGKRRVLVTGGTGFIGGALARVLAKAGHDVLTIGRNPYRVAFAPTGPNFLKVDIRDRDAVREACADRDLVFHCAAYASPWGDSKIFDAVNVDGTRNVIAACLARTADLPSTRLVHVSSTAVQFDFRDGADIPESAPFASPFSCHYARTKALAEELVQEKAAAGLNAVIVRARAVFGPGDNHLFPRLLEAADQRRLRVIGSRQTRLDFTYIDNLLLALILAAEAGDAGRTYTVTNDEPVELWPFLEETLRQTGRTQPLAPISRGLALRAAGLMEWWHRFRGADGEPATTKYTVGLLSTTKTFDITAAQKDLGYQPIVNMHTAQQRTIHQLMAKDESQADVCVDLKLFTTGYTFSRASLAEHGADRNRIFRFHALIGVIDHPHFGRTLFDTGYSPRYFDATARLPYRLYRQATPVVTDDRLAAVEVLKANGISPDSIERILLSHFHADHTCGLRDFPQVDIVCSQRSYDDIRNARGWGALRRAFLPDLMPDDLSARVCPLDLFHGPGFGPFDRCHDLFGDGSVRLFDLSGHAPGQLGALIQRGSDDRVFLLADACWTTRTIVENLPLTLPFRLLADDKHEATATVRRLYEFHHAYPDIELVLTHCPDVAERCQLDAQLAPFDLPADASSAPA